MNRLNWKILFVCLTSLFLVALVCLSLIIINDVKSLKGNPDEDLRMIKSEMVSQTYYSVTDGGVSVDYPDIQSYLQDNGLTESPLLVIRYSNFSCSHCLDYLIEKLEKYFSDYASNPRILFVASDFKADPMTKFGNTIILKNGEDLGMEMEALNTPFFFILSNGYSFNAYAPDGSLDDQCETYLSAVKEKYSL